MGRVDQVPVEMEIVREPRGPGAQDDDVAERLGAERAEHDSRAQCSGPGGDDRSRHGRFDFRVRIGGPSVGSQKDNRNKSDNEIQSLK